MGKDDFGLPAIESVGGSVTIGFRSNAGSGCSFAPRLIEGNLDINLGVGDAGDPLRGPADRPLVVCGEVIVRNGFSVVEILDWLVSARAR